MKNKNKKRKIRWQRVPLLPNFTGFFSSVPNILLVIVDQHNFAKRLGKFNESCLKTDGVFAINKTKKMCIVFKINLVQSIQTTLLR